MGKFVHKFEELQNPVNAGIFCFLTIKNEEVRIDRAAVTVLFSTENLELWLAKLAAK